MTVVVSGARIAAADGVIDDGWLVASDRIDALGTGAPPRLDEATRIDLHGHWLAPGFVDLHCHGGGGSSIYSGNVDDVRIAAKTHGDAGTTTMLASIGSMALPRMLEAARAIATAIDDGSAPHLAGIHFEGPFLSRSRAGAQTVSALTAPDDEVFSELMAAAGGHARMMTVAPELPGALEFIAAHDELAFALGHTDATADEFSSGVDAGAKHVTHLFNAMPPFSHRTPGALARGLLDARLTVELIVDGHHLADDTVRLALRTAGPERIVLVTDAMAAAGLGDGHYSFADREVDVVDGVATLAGRPTIAGSTLLLHRAVERLVDRLGVAVPDAVRMSSTNAADLMGWTDRGRIAVGAKPDLVELDDRGRLVGRIPVG
jgi:N-acetylglucosamine-6-phosphate deacetylase